MQSRPTIWKAALYTVFNIYDSDGHVKYDKSWKRILASIFLPPRSFEFKIIPTRPYATFGLNFIIGLALLLSFLAIPITLTKGLIKLVLELPSTAMCIFCAEKRWNKARKFFGWAASFVRYASSFNPVESFKEARARVVGKTDEEKRTKTTGYLEGFVAAFISLGGIVGFAFAAPAIILVVAQAVGASVGTGSLVSAILGSSNLLGVPTSVIALSAVTVTANSVTSGIDVVKSCCYKKVKDLDSVPDSYEQEDSLGEDNHDDAFSFDRDGEWCPSTAIIGNYFGAEMPQSNGPPAPPQDDESSTPRSSTTYSGGFSRDEPEYSPHVTGTSPK